MHDAYGSKSSCWVFSLNVMEKTRIRIGEKMKECTYDVYIVLDCVRKKETDYSAIASKM